MENKGWLFLALCLVFASCGPTYKLRRAQKLIAQAIAAGAEYKSDTVYQEKTIITKGDSTTIFVPVTRLKDSLVTVYQDRIKIQYRLKHDTIRFNVECDPDTVKISVPVAVNTEIDCPPRSSFWRNLALALIVVTSIVLFFALRR